MALFRCFTISLLLLTMTNHISAEDRDERLKRFFAGEFSWTSSQPLVSPADTPDDVRYSFKDPSFVFHNNKWHLFGTVRGKKRTHAIEYLSFDDWANADRAQRHVLDSITTGYFCAPQVFYFTPHAKWYLIYQTSDSNEEKHQRVAYSTTADIADPKSWTPPQGLYERRPEIVKAWLDFWIICDDRSAYLFYTSLDGKMWRAQTALADFPQGWSDPVIALEGDIFEASHTYKLKGMNKYLTVIEAMAWPRRYYKAYLADRLDGAWTPLADSFDKPFASVHSVQQDRRWTDSISHIELVREGFDEKLEVDPANLRVVFQGVSDEDMKDKPYGQIPWKLGMLEMRDR